MDFSHPYFLILALLLPLWWVLYRKMEKETKTGIRFSSLKQLKNIEPAPAVQYRHLPFLFKLLALLFLIIALARPQTAHGNKELTKFGIDIMIALDISTSMDLGDIEPSRLEAAKKAILKFIDNRNSDRIGLILFSGSSFTKAPLTLDYSVLKQFIKPVKSGIIEDGTAIGMAIANSVNRLKQSKAKSKIVILLTDGVNNKGLIDPQTATELAVAEKIKIYTIGLGRPGLYNMEVNDPYYGRRTMRVKSEIDEKLLQEVAGKTGGKYFAARNEEELNHIYGEIDRLEKTKIKSKIYYDYSENFMFPAWLALILLIVDWLLSNLLLRRLPE